MKLGIKSVLLKDINDNSETLKELFHKLLKVRVKPYYLYQADMTMGTNHFRTSVEKGLQILSDLAGHTTGLAVPYYVIDAPGGGGKVRLLPNAVVEQNDHEIVIRNFKGKLFRYPLPSKEKNEEKPTPTKGKSASTYPLCTTV